MAAPQVKQKRYDETEEIVENDTENIDWYVKDRLSTSWAKKGGWRPGRPRDSVQVRV